MPERDEPRQDNFEEASAQLSEGLKSCRSVLNDYRAIISGEPGHNDNEETEAGYMSRYVSTTDSGSGTDATAWDQARS